MDKMEAKDWITVSIAGAALVWSIGWSVLSYFLNKWGNQKVKQLAESADQHATEANTLAGQANAIADQSARRLTAESEMSVLRLINEARMRACNLALQMEQVREGRKKPTADDDRYILAIYRIYEEAVETLLNSYELACGMYLDDKIEKERFRRQYYREMANLFNFDDPYKKMLHPVNSEYDAIRKVRDLWHNLEK